MKVILTKLNRMVGKYAKVSLLMNDQIMMTVKTGETVSCDISNTKTIILKSHFMIKPCVIDLKTNYSEITIFCQILNEPFKMKTLIQAIVTTKEKFVGIFTSDDQNNDILV